MSFGVKVVDSVLTRGGRREREREKEKEKERGGGGGEPHSSDVQNDAQSTKNQKKKI